MPTSYPVPDSRDRFPALDGVVYDGGLFQRSSGLRRVPIFILLLLAAVAAPGGVPGNENAMTRIFPYPTHVEKLDNGLKVILVPMSSNGLVSYWSIVRTGSRDEFEPGHTGFAHFFEHMMFRGTEKFPQEVYGQILTEMGADANAFTSSDLTAYHLSVTSGDLERVMEIEADRFQNLSYPKPAFETEAGAVYGEYRKNRMNPMFTIYEAIYQEAFREHTYGHTTMGYERDIKAMPGMYDYSRSFFARYYRPDNVVLLVVGDIDAEGAMASIRKHYGAWQPGYVAPDIPPEPPQTAERRIDVSYPGQSLPVLWVGYKVDAFDPANPTRVAVDLLAELAFGETSEIHKKLVLDEQVVEFLAAGTDPSRDPRLLDIYARVKDPSKVDYVLAEIDRTVARYREAPPDGERLADLRSRLKYAFLMNLDTPDHVASSLDRFISATGGIEAVDQLFGAYESVTAEQVLAAAAAYLSPERRTIAVLRGQS
jgi:zinc protease